jgi:hypothetical protein
MDKKVDYCFACGCLGVLEPSATTPGLFARYYGHAAPVRMAGKLVPPLIQVGFGSIAVESVVGWHVVASSREPNPWVFLRFSVLSRAPR